MDNYDETTNTTFIKKYQLRDGTEKILLEVSPLFDLHISCRNEDHKGWCIISTFDYTGKLEANRDNWLPLENEIFALRMDGSKMVHHLVHHRSRRYTAVTPDSDKSIYWAETHATISRSAKKIC